jgi:predicted kinase
MRQLVVMVGLPGSGKSLYLEERRSMVIVCRDMIRQEVFSCTYASEYEESIDRIFSSMVIEAVQSPASTVCIDDLNLLRSERRPYVELGRLSDRETVAVVMPHTPVDVLYARVCQQMENLRIHRPRIDVRMLSRERFGAMARCYEAVRPEEGFSRVLVQETLPQTAVRAVPGSRSRARKRETGDTRQRPIPLFAP